MWRFFSIVDGRHVPTMGVAHFWIPAIWLLRWRGKVVWIAAVRSMKGLN
jgi:hypothetical protein